MAEWLAVVPALLLGAALLLLPGLSCAAALGMRGYGVVAAAPAVSCELIGVSAILAGAVGLPWSLWVPLIATVLVTLSLRAVVLLVRRRASPGVRAALSSPVPAAAGRPPRRRPGGASSGTGRSVPTRGAGPADAARSRPTPDRAAWVGVAVAVPVLGAVLLWVLGTPEIVSQTYDVTFHLNAVRYILDTGDGSSLHLTHLTTREAPAYFYPAVWHDLAALVAGTTGLSVPAATSVQVLLTGVLCFPLGMVRLVQTIAPLRPGMPAVAGVLSAGLCAFPLLPASYGVLYPNYLGYALVPALLALVLELLGPAGGLRRRSPAGPAGLLLLLGALGAGLAHPNAVMSLLVLCLPVVLSRGLREIRSGWERGATRRVLAVRTALLAGALAVFAVLWWRIRPAASAASWQPSASFGRALWEAVGLVPIGPLGVIGPSDRYHPQLVMALLVLVGAVAAWRRGAGWLVGAYALCLWLYLAVRSLPFDAGRNLWTGIWYNDVPRVAALAGLAAIPLAVLGADAVLGAVLRRWGAGSRALAPVAAAALLLVLTQAAQPMRHMVADARQTYRIQAGDRLLDPDELRVLREVGSLVPEGETILANPHRGGALAYALTGRPVSSPHLLEAASPDVELLQRRLREAREDPAVCAAVHRTGVRYVLDFPGRQIPESGQSQDYVGIRDLPSRGVAREVYRSGAASLLEITACGG